MKEHIGFEGKDIISQTKGTIVGFTMWLYGCNRYVLEYRDTEKDKKPVHESFDFQRIEVGKKQIIKPEFRESRIITLGSEVKDKLTGFTGIATGRTYWLSGLIDIVIEPTKLKDGKPLEHEVFSLERIIVIKDAKPPMTKAAEKIKAPGGPYPTPRRSDR